MRSTTGHRRARHRATAAHVPLIALAGAALALAACGSSTSPSTTSSPATKVSSSSSPYGTILVTSTGRTLYAYSADTATTSRCNGACAQTWNPLVTIGPPVVAASADRGFLATLTRNDGTTQVVYAGHPLYTYSGDLMAHQINGQGVGGAWHVVTVTGQIVSSSGGTSGTSSPTTTTTPASTTTTPHTPTTAAPPTTTTTAPPPTTIAPTTTTIGPSSGH